ncbi:response regulator [Alteromonas marina]|jgi:excisionase family DNA binding protein|uniref:Response regulator n=1 Tax=Alteromonas marina TaxID=203795 RepID=A0A0B3YJV2_9ALTE|nr:response regulator [Alteromonas marina]KHT54993.1 response regulator [Alteromonas marina]|tara:strand:+ start:543 stop:1103 length:561 start_codon:yes stop_codon:yes gene_type:complete
MKTLTSGEIASYCDVNLRTVIRWIESGKLKGFKLPGRGNNRILVEDFIEFLERHDMPIPDALRGIASPSILIVDDEMPVAKSIQRVARRAGFDSYIATGGFQAGIMLSQYEPKVMTLDLSMPGMDGYSVIEFTREQSKYKDLKIIVISALDDISLERALEIGADATLQKPFSNHDLTNVLEQFMSL